LQKLSNIEEDFFKLFAWDLKFDKSVMSDWIEYDWLIIKSLKNTDFRQRKTEQKVSLHERVINKCIIDDIDINQNRKIDIDFIAF